MTALTWDATGTRLFETGVDKGVLYIPDTTGAYANGVAWNGLTAVTETPSGAAASPLYADNVKYLNLISTEDFAADLEAYTYPDEFQAFDGLGVPTNGVGIAQQSRGVFGLSYRTKIGNDVDGDAHGYKLHLVYGCQAAPSQKAYKSVNDKPDGITFKWTLTTTPVPVLGTYNSKMFKNTALLTIDSTKVNATNLAALELLLYGTVGVNPVLPLPDAVITGLTSGITTVATITPPSYVSSTHIMTIPTTVGVDYYITKITSATGAVVTAKAKATAGAQVALATGQEWLINAVPQANYVFGSGNVDEWIILFASADRSAS